MHPRRPWTQRLDYGSFLGLVLAFAAILGGLTLEGGSIGDIRQLTAAIIVLGGTFGAVMITVPPRQLIRVLRRIPSLFVEPHDEAEDWIELILSYATIARRRGLIGLEDELESVPDPFLRKALELAVDGMPLVQLRQLLKNDLKLMIRAREAEIRVLDCAGGYSPTMGILGAVLGLIQVMKQLQNIDEVGRGIAVAFVATVYGVGAANIIFIPGGHKLRARLHHDIQMRELALEGIAGILDGVNPSMIRRSLEGFSKTKSELTRVSEPAQTVASRGIMNEQ